MVNKLTRVKGLLRTRIQSTDAPLRAHSGLNWALAAEMAAPPGGCVWFGSRRLDSGLRETEPRLDNLCSRRSMLTSLGRRTGTGKHYMFSIYLLLAVKHKANQGYRQLGQLPSKDAALA